MFRRAFLAALLALPLCHGAALSAEKVKAVATFSILADLVRNVGGDRVEVSVLVGPNGDAHVYSPKPSDGRRLADSRIIFTNGLGFEGWINRLISSSGTKARVVVASQGITPLSAKDHDDHEAEHGNKHDHGSVDPHAWQSVANVTQYVANIRDGLVAVDPDGKDVYSANAATYLAKLDALDRDIQARFSSLSEDQRKVVTSHDAFHYFGDRYKFRFIAAQGISTDSEVSARQLARLIQQVKRENVKAVFVENMTNPKIVQRLVKETGAKAGGQLYSDALSDDTGPASTYLDMMRYNAETLSSALTH